VKRQDNASPVGISESKAGEAPRQHEAGAQARVSAQGGFEADTEHDSPRVSAICAWRERVPLDLAFGI
jgi:hypothetical protein